LNPPQSPFGKGGIKGGFRRAGWIFPAQVPPLSQRGGWGINGEVEIIEIL